VAMVRAAAFKLLNESRKGGGRKFLKIVLGTGFNGECIRN
jgi:hypothetical protein